MKMEKEQVKMKCGCVREVDNDFDKANLPKAECLEHVQGFFPWFMHPHPDGQDPANWSKVDGEWVLVLPDRGAGHWEWKMPDFSKGEESAVPVFVEN